MLSSSIFDTSSIFQHKRGAAVVKAEGKRGKHSAKEDALERKVPFLPVQQICTGGAYFCSSYYHNARASSTRLVRIRPHPMGTWATILPLHTRASQFGRPDRILLISLRIFSTVRKDS